MSIGTYPNIKKMSPQLIVANLDSSIEFYTNNLGFVIDFRYENFYVGIIRGAFSIHLKTGKTSITERQTKKDNEHLDIVFSVDDIESLYQELSNRSVEVIQPLRKMSYGKEFYIADPDGYIIAFVE